MTAGKKKKPAVNYAQEFPALRGFFSGYLHQDFRDEYGSVAGAAKAFRNDASEAEVTAVQNEWKRWRATILNSSAHETGKALRQLGCFWQPQNSSEMDLLQEAILID